MNYEFITPAKLTNLAECTALVCGIVELLKYCTPINPVYLSLLVSILVSFIRLLIINKWDTQTVMIGLLNAIPMFTAACGAYDTIKSLF